MGPFWSSFFDHLKTCGRNVTLFMVTLAALFVVVTLGAAFWGERFGDYILRLIPGAVVVGAIWLGVAIRREHLRRRDRLRFPPLSVDEWRKARTKLVRARR